MRDISPLILNTYEDTLESRINRLEKSDVYDCRVAVSYLGYLYTTAEVLRVYFNSFYVYDSKNHCIGRIFRKSPLVKGSDKYVFLGSDYYSLHDYLLFFMSNSLLRVFRHSGNDFWVTHCIYDCDFWSSNFLRFYSDPLGRRRRLSIFTVYPCFTGGSFKLGVSFHLYNNSKPLDKALESYRQECVNSMISIGLHSLTLDKFRDTVTYRYHPKAGCEDEKAYLMDRLSRFFLELAETVEDAYADAFVVENIVPAVSFVCDYVFDDRLTKRDLQKVLKTDRFAGLRVLHVR
ncbi:MAG: hypothetical protein KatS3mg087_0018 [Patescibacteria group bacterium]|nr:MAG: hypothetical protein KatS3mg087_0018 [Patescibacteria group bacterium]